jgi:L-cysteine S-thiosulfotransferase
MDSGVRSGQFLYQKIADPRLDNPKSAMTVNLANGLMNEREVCDLVSYIIAPK